MLEGITHELRAAGRFRFDKEPAHVFLHIANRGLELARDLLIHQALSHKLQHACLPWREIVLDRILIG